MNFNSLCLSLSLSMSLSLFLSLSLPLSLFISLSLSISLLSLSLSPSLSLSLSQSSPFNLRGYHSRLWSFIYSNFSSFWGVGLPAYFSDHNPFSRENIFVGFNKFPSPVYCCTVIHHHRPHWRLDFTCVQCNVCTDTGPPVLSPIRED